MFFSGDPTSRKRVALGGRSSKERDTQKLMEQTRMERDRRLWQRKQNASAIKIQKCFRGRKAAKAERAKVREQFLSRYGSYCQNAERCCFCPDSDYFRQLFFFFNARNAGDFTILVETCRGILNLVRDNDNIVSLFAGVDYSAVLALVDHRVKNLAYICILSLYQNRSHFRQQLLVPDADSVMQATVLLEAVAALIDPKLPWACKAVSYLCQKNVFALFREIVLAERENAKTSSSTGNLSGVEHITGILISHSGQNSCSCPNVDPKFCFSSQMLTVPFLWKNFPSLKGVFSTQGLSQHYIHQMSLCLQNHTNLLPSDISAEYPGYACLLGNILEAAGVTLSQPACPFEMAVDLAAVSTFLLEALPPIKSSSQKAKEDAAMIEEDADSADDIQIVLDKDLERQIITGIDSRFLLQLPCVLLQINVLFGGISAVGDDRSVVAIGAACALLHVTFNTLPLERVMTVLAYRTELVRVLWEFMKNCHDNKRWSSLPEHLSLLPGDSPGWLLPLAVFCPVYKHMLMIVDNEEFYEQERPLSLRDIRSLIVILRQALWQLLWLNPTAPNASAKTTSRENTSKQNPNESIKHRVSIVASELLSQLQDWNNRREFTPPSDFHADGVDDFFISQAVVDGTKANEIMKLAPFLIPFTSRVKIFNSQLVAVKQRHGPHGVFARNRFTIRRDRILEDAYNQMSALSEEDLRGLIRVTFVNELGVEEAGIDGGGIFKDFMENITRAAFDVQYGLFKETVDHLLYPNPGSGLIHEQHLQFFHFLGCLLAKAMFEGVLVDIPFATFFLSKLKQKFNYLNDLPSLDPELYRHLIFLKMYYVQHYQGDIAGLELYFVIVNNEYGEQTEEELLPGGRNLRVTNENVITFIHLVSNHRLNFQIRQQSSHFLRGFQQLIQKDWIDMFNEHELQLLISGSLESLDVDDLRIHTNYAGGYHKEHYVIDMFWDVIKGFSLENQKKFLKFVTGCSRGPLLGFKYLEPLFCIQRAAGNASDEALDRLPTSATCMNLLKLPPYRSKEQMEAKLLYAINAEAGFDLS
ncbi:unnamed protein product [Linum tenue]|uniref:HECT-type E3 ubiquitin transferase n=1 Tax=Linum tenue TaxID=586396 RepID=A0AAV0S2M6_9ROSI|nr:unnamed protein product [Linum tenue]